MKNLDYKSRVLFFYKKAREDGYRPQQAMIHAKHFAKYGEGSPKLDVLPSPYSAYEGEQVTDLSNGWKIKVEFEYDHDYGKPWEECDGHGVIYETHSREEYMDEWLLNNSRGWYRYYDWKESLKLAIKDKWGCKPYDTSTAMDAIKADYEWLRRWCNDDWWWVGMIVTLLDEDDNEIDSDSCWGYDSDSIDYLCSEARSWAAHMIRKERKVQRNVRQSALIREAMSEGARV